MQDETPMRVTDRRRLDEEGELRTEQTISDAKEEAGAVEIELPDESQPDLVPREELDAAVTRAMQAEAQLEQFKDAYQRYRNEHDAVRMRLERDLEGRVQTALGRSFSRLLAALDSLDRALEFADDTPLAQGMTLVRQQIRDALAEEGLAPIEVVGRPFDPETAEAVSIVEVEDAQRADLVLGEIRRGYRFGDQVLRAAQVQVGRLREAAEPNRAGE